MYTLAGFLFLNTITTDQANEKDKTKLIQNLINKEKSVKKFTLVELKGKWSQIDCPQLLLLKSTKTTITFDQNLSNIKRLVMKYILHPSKKRDDEHNLTVDKISNVGYIASGGKYLEKTNIFNTKELIAINSKHVIKVVKHLHTEFPSYINHCMISTEKYFAKNNNAIPANKFKEFVYDDLLSQCRVNMDAGSLANDQELWCFNVYETKDGSFVKTPLLYLKNKNGKPEWKLIVGDSRYTYQTNPKKSVEKFIRSYDFYNYRNINVNSTNDLEGNVKLDALPSDNIKRIIETHTLFQDKNELSDIGYLERNYVESHYDYRNNYGKTLLFDIKDDTKLKLKHKLVKKAFNEITKNKRKETIIMMQENMKLFFKNKGTIVTGHVFKNYVRDVLLKYDKEQCILRGYYSPLIYKYWRFVIMETEIGEFIKSDLFCIEQLGDGKTKISIIYTNKINAQDVDYEIVRNENIDTQRVCRPEHEIVSETVLEVKSEKEESTEQEQTISQDFTTDSSTKEYILIKHTVYGVCALLIVFTLTSIVIFFARKTKVELEEH